MSQNLVEKEHVNAIITWGIEKDCVVGPIQKLFQDLYSDNLESLKITYPEEEFDIPESWKYRPETEVLKGINKYDVPITVGIYKLIVNWKYNSDNKLSIFDIPLGISESELKYSHFGWDAMEYMEKHIHQKLELTAEQIKQSDLYKKAPWSYTRQKWKEYRSFLTKENLSNSQWLKVLKSNGHGETSIERSELEQTLDTFIGTSAYHRLNKRLCPNFVCTDGVLHLMEKVSCFWLGDVMMSVQSLEEVEAIDPQFWQLDVDLEEGDAKVICHDGQSPKKTVYTQSIPITDFPYAQLKIWVCQAEDLLVAMLPSEY